MTINVFKTKASALYDAKRLAIRELENWNNVTVSDEKLMENESLWLIEPKSCTCTCGQTNAVEATLFSANLTDELLGFPRTELEYHSTQFTGFAGICDTCGQEA